VAAHLARAHTLLGSLKEILFEDVRFESAARLAGNNEQRLGNVDLMLERLHLRGIGGIEHMQSRKVRNPAERHTQNFRAKAGSAHA
jgi:hypothetical protein